jgi:hypothetical protein
VSSRLFVAFLATFAGLAAIAFGAYGLTQISPVESTLAFARMFQESGGAVDRSAWRFGVQTAMALSIGFGVLCLGAAAGLLLKRSFAPYLWFALVVVAGASALPDALTDRDAQIWLLACAVVLVLSWVGLRASGVRGT